MSRGEVEFMNSKLKKARVSKKISVANIVNKLDISASYYYKIESGLRNPNLVMAKRIADLLDSSVDELFFSGQLDESSKNEQKTA
jgi:putative transcriptional regulator